MPTPTEQLLSRTVFATDGSTTIWDFSFSGGYLDPAHVKAYTEDSLGSRTLITVTPSMLIGTYQLQITPPLPTGLSLVIYRDTPKDLPLVDFTDESGFSEIALDTNAKQAVFIAAETQDALGTYSTTAAGLAAAAASASAASASAFAAASLASANAAIASPVAAPTLAAASKTVPVDADVIPIIDSAAGNILKKISWLSIKTALYGLFVRLTDLASNAGATLVGYLPAGTGAVATNVQAKLRESVSVGDFGAVGNGIVNDAAAIQAAITATAAGGTLFFPAGNYIISSQLTISKAITIRGSTQYQTAIIAVACSGLLISFASHVQLHNLEIAASVRHTVTPNAYIGIDVAGSTGTRPFNHVYRDVFIDGFSIGYRSAWLWSSTFSNFKTGACPVGIKATNLSVNNVVNGCSFSGAAGLVGSRGLQLDGNTDPTEGWMISDTLFDDFEISIEGIAATHVYVSNCIIDHNRVNGILISGSGANFGGNWIVRGCYIAMQGASGDAAIKSTNAASNTQNRGNIITGNQVLVYAGSTCINGIQMSGSQAINNVITDNTIKGFSTYDIRTNTGPDIVTNNSCQSAIATNLLIAGSSIVKNNRGVLNFAEFTQFETLGQNKVTWSYSIPTTGTWTQGDICWKSNVTAGGSPGWHCTTGGTPGTWKAMAVVAA